MFFFVFGVDGGCILVEDKVEFWCGLFIFKIECFIVLMLNGLVFDLVLCVGREDLFEE